MNRSGLKSVGIEFVVVVLGVAVALAADSWRQGLGDRRAESEYIGRMAAELEAGLPQIQLHRGRVVEALAASDSLLMLDAAAREPAALASLIIRSARYGFVAESIELDQTYNEMLATGSLGLIRSSEMRREIASYFRLSDRTGGLVTASRDNGQREWVGRVRGAVASLSAEPDAAAVARLTSLLDAPDWESAVRRSVGALGTLRFWLTTLENGTHLLLEQLRDSEAG